MRRPPHLELRYNREESYYELKTRKDADSEWETVEQIADPEEACDRLRVYLNQWRNEDE